MFESIKLRYEKGYIRHDQLRRYVELKVITESEFKEISKEDF